LINCISLCVAATLGVTLQMVTHFSTVSQFEKPSEIADETWLIVSLSV
jgi:hypothetical protein